LGSRSTARRTCSSAPLADGLALGLVDDDHGDVGQRLALLDDDRGIGEGHEDRGGGQGPPDGAARAHGETEADDRGAEAAEDDDRQPGQQRREGDGGLAGRHCPSLLRIVGMCTWSAL
jgi:hypothetical protein